MLLNEKEEQFDDPLTVQINKYADRCINNSCIDPNLYDKFDVKRGLRDRNTGKGVLTGLTEIGDVHSYETIDGKVVPVEGKLFYRGIDVEDIVHGFLKENRFGFEEVTYLLLFGELPSEKRLANFNKVLAEYRTLPPSFVRDIIMKATSRDMMNLLARSVLSLYSWDENPDDTSIPNVLRQSLSLIARVPLISVYGYQAHRHYHHGDNLYIINPDVNLSTAENILRLLRPDSSYTELEAKILDLALVLHAEHGGGNNSTFTDHVVSSSGTDTYSAIAAALCSLKGPKHGGANIKVKHMFDHMKETINDWNDDDEIKNYLNALLEKRIFDQSGLIYGIGHAVYAISDPRAKLLKAFTKDLAAEKNRLDEFALYQNVERLAPEVISKAHKRQKSVGANVDFYSGFVYSMLGLPDGLYTPMFASARMAGWCAHRIEELINAGKIIRPAYKNVAKKAVYGYVSIDSIAGPSEILVLADETANPRYIAADLLSQAEHDEMASAILITTNEEFADQVDKEVRGFVEVLSRKAIIEKSLENFGYILIAEDMDEAIEAANEIASEHMEIVTKNPFEDMMKVRNAGAIFIGEHSSEPLGDYFAGPNHVLPTNGTAKFFSALSVDDFIKKSSIVYYSRKALRKIHKDIIQFATSEQLTAHANSIAVRFEEEDKENE